MWWAVFGGIRMQQIGWADNFSFRSGKFLKYKNEINNKLITKLLIK